MLNLPNEQRWRPWKERKHRTCHTESGEKSIVQSTLIFDEAVEFDAIEDFLFAKRPSVLSADVIDVDAPIRSRGAGALASLLLLLSFRLRRRTGFFRIRLRRKTEARVDELVQWRYLPKAGFSFTKWKSWRWLSMLSIVWMIRRALWKTKKKCIDMTMAVFFCSRCKKKRAAKRANSSSPSGNSSRSLRFSNRVVRDLIRRNQDVSSRCTNPISARATNAPGCLLCWYSAFCSPYLLEGIEVATVDDYLTTLMIWWTWGLLLARVLPCISLMLPTVKARAMGDQWIPWWPMPRWKRNLIDSDDDGDRSRDGSDTNQVHWPVAVEQRERVVLCWHWVLGSYVPCSRPRQLSRSSPVTRKEKRQMSLTDQGKTRSMKNDTSVSLLGSVEVNRRIDWSKCWDEFIMSWPIIDQSERVYPSQLHLAPEFHRFGRSESKWRSWRSSNRVRSISWTSSQDERENWSVIRFPVQSSKRHLDNHVGCKTLV